MTEDLKKELDSIQDKLKSIDNKINSIEQSVEGLELEINEEIEKGIENRLTGLQKFLLYFFMIVAGSSLIGTLIRLLGF